MSGKYINVSAYLNPTEVNKWTKRKIASVKSVCADVDTKIEVAEYCYDLFNEYVPYSRKKVGYNPTEKGTGRILHHHMADDQRSGVDAEGNIYYIGYNEKEHTYYTSRAYYKTGIRKYYTGVHPKAHKQWDKYAIQMNQLEFNLAIAQIVRRRVWEEFHE